MSFPLIVVSVALLIFFLVVPISYAKNTEDRIRFTLRQWFWTSVERWTKYQARVREWKAWQDAKHQAHVELALAALQNEDDWFIDDIELPEPEPVAPAVPLHFNDMDQTKVPVPKDLGIFVPDELSPLSPPERNTTNDHRDTRHRSPDSLHHRSSRYWEIGGLKTPRSSG